MKLFLRFLAWLSGRGIKSRAIPVPAPATPNRKPHVRARSVRRRRRGMLALDAQSSIVGQLRDARIDRGL